MARGGYRAVGGSTGDVSYDDSAFELFLLAFLCAFWIPTVSYRVARAIFRVRAPPPPPVEVARSQWCKCRACQSRANEQRKKNRPPVFGCFGIFDVALICATALICLLLFRVYSGNSDVEDTIFDPFAILGVSESASKRDISKAYRRLAVTHHPDKMRDDPEAGEKFIRITKAYAALTDEASAENYKKYGNPDGYVGTTLGIGLPSWIQDNNSAMLVGYLVLLVMFPVLVGLWWRRQSRLLPTSVTTETFMLYRNTIAQTQRFVDLMGCLSGSLEFADLHKSMNSDALRELSNALKRLGKDDMRRVKCVTRPQPYQVQNLMLLSAHLSRVDIPAELQYAMDEIMLRAESLLTAMTDTIGAFQRPDCQAAWPKVFMRGHTTYLNTCIHLSQCVIQAVDKGDSPLLQIPGFTEREVRYCMSSRTHPARTVHEFSRLEAKSQRELLRAFTDEQFLDVVAFCDQYPLVLLDLQEPFVEGEEDTTVHADDTVTVNAKLTVMRRSGSVYSPHTPNLPYKKNEVWWVCLADKRLMCPIEVRRLLPKHARGHDPDRVRPREKKAFVLDEEIEKEGVGETELDTTAELAKDPRVTVYDLKFNFVAPRKGTYTLELSACVDCYVGCDRAKTVVMEVADPAEPETSHTQRYFDTDDESDYGSSEVSDDEDEEGSAKADETDSEYEYIEVTASDPDEDRDPDDLDDELGET